MKNTLKLLLTLVVSILVASCGGNQTTETESTSEEAPVSMVADEIVTSDFNESLGVGPISSVTIGEEVDEAMAAKGKEVFDAMCMACHRVDKKFVGPSPKGVMDRRTPEWVMNMILNPEEMVLEDPLAKQLLIEFNGAPMANQNVSEEDARAIVEYFRTL
jgi:cytochrome c